MGMLFGLYFGGWGVVWMVILLCVGLWILVM